MNQPPVDTQSLQVTPAPENLSGLPFICIRCSHDLAAPAGDPVESACANCGFGYLIGDGFIKYNADPLLFEKFKKKFLLYKVLSNNGYIAYKTLAESSLSLDHRDDVREFKKYIEAAVPKGRILDIGCGILPVPGYLAFEHRDRYELFGLDPIEETAFRGVKIIGCAEYLPFADNVFDAIVFATSLDHVCSLDKTASEALRVLRPDGKLLIWMGDRSQPLSRRLVAKIKTLARNIVRGYRTDRYTVYENLSVFYTPKGAIDSFHSFPETPAFFTSMLCKAGFVREDQTRYESDAFLRFAKP